MSSNEPTTDRQLNGRGQGALEKYKGVLRLAAVLIVILLIATAFLTTSDVLRRTDMVKIENVGRFEYEPDEVGTVRPDVFAPGHFSVFDILVHLNGTGKVPMTYHWDPALGTHVIDDLEGRRNWWYRAYYDGGWSESNNFRMDLYPYKEGMYIEVIRSTSTLVDSIHLTFAEEVRRLEANNGTVVIPTVTITGPGLAHVFDDVEVTAHDLRDDMLRPGTVTAIDVIMSLGDQGKLTYDLQFYDNVGSAEVKNYFVSGIDGQRAEGRCGFVYEEGDKDLRFGNHIHIPPDIRVITSPEYEEWFWICL